MFPKVGTIIAIVGLLISLLLSIIGHVMILSVRSSTSFMVSQTLGIAEGVVLHISLLVFMVAFLASLKSSSRV